MLTSTIVSDVGLGTQTSLLRIADSVSWTVIVGFASDYADALDVRIGIRYGLLRTGASVRAFSVGTCCSMTANVGLATLVDICIRCEKCK